MIAVKHHARLALAAVLSVACVIGYLPTAAEAQEARERRSNILIRSNAEFDIANGVRSGSGTVTDPYVISGWEVSNITIKDTSAHVVITDNTVTSQLVLDWIGGGATVTDNDINDLRVNQNVPRTGEPTSGLIAHNTFGVVGQLRHFDGVFEENVVGSPDVGDVDRLYGEVFTNRAVNFDGFNGAQFRNNEIFGYVEVRLHGHHHSSGFGQDSHQHSGSMDAMDHTQRYHEVWVTGNEITVAPGTFAALEYVDNNHAGNDRTAASETNPDLNLPHVHNTRVHITDNHLMGSGLAVEIFNADDQNHVSTQRGRVDLDGNTIMLSQRLLPFSWVSGISVRDATDLDLYIRDNHIVGPDGAEDAVADLVHTSVGIDLSQIDKAYVRLYDNNVEHATYGVYASTFNETRWFFDGMNMSDVETPLYYSSNMPKPEDRADDPDPDSGYTGGPPDDPHQH